MPAGRCAPGVRRPAGDLVPRLGLRAAAAASLAVGAGGATAAAADGATVPAAAAPAARAAADCIRKSLRQNCWQSWVERINAVAAPIGISISFVRVQL